MFERNYITLFVTDGTLSIEEMGMTYVSIPIQILPDISLQQPLLEAIYTDGVTNNTIFIDPSQVITRTNIIS